MGKWEKIEKASKSLEEFISEPTTQAMMQLKQSGRKKQDDEPLVSIHLKLRQSDVEFLDKQLANILRNSGQSLWQGNIYRPQLINYLINYYKRSENL